MKYDPKIHHRKSIRLSGYDYSQAGAYFITACCYNKKSWFGKVEKDEMVLNEYGMVAYNEWIKLTERFSNFELDVFQIMPNHMHGIIVLNEVGKYSADIKEDEARATARVAPTIGDITGSYKSLVANECLKIFKLKWHNVGAGLAPAHSNVGAGLAPAHSNVGAGLAPAHSDMHPGAGASPAPTQMGKLWQRNYFEHIIRNEKSYQMISNYIINNPNTWKDDRFFEE